MQFHLISFQNNSLDYELERTFLHTYYPYKNEFAKHLVHFLIYFSFFCLFSVFLYFKTVKSTVGTIFSSCELTLNCHDY